MKSHVFNIEQTIFLPFTKEYHAQGTHNGISQLEIGTNVGPQISNWESTRKCGDSFLCIFSHFVSILGIHFGTLENFNHFNVTFTNRSKLYYKGKLVTPPKSRLCELMMNPR